MSSELPGLDTKTLIRILNKHGFKKSRQSGSHAVLKHADGRRTTVPVHSGRTIGRGLLRRILRDADLTPGDLSK